MSFFNDVERAVKGFSAGNVRVADFRLSLVETVQSGLGIGSNRRGSPYEPLTVSDAAGGSILLSFTDTTVSRGSLTRAPLAALEEVLMSAYEGRYEDPDVADFPADCEVPELGLLSSECADIAAGKNALALPQALEVMEGVRDECGARLLDASVRAVHIRRRVVSSGGFRGEGESTRTAFSVAFDSLAFDGHESRSPFPLEEVLRRSRWTAADYRALSEDSSEKPSGKTKVLLHPRVAESFLRTFLFASLSGAAVANGRSRFNIEDFREGRAAFREDLGIRTKPLVPMGVGSFRFTDEGLVARDLELVSSGRLVTPVLGLKYARRLDMEPTPVPGSMDGYEFASEGSVGAEEALAEGGPLVLVHSVLGMHTQDPVRGEYSVLAPQAVVYADGRPKGRVSTTLNGSFFTDLKSSELSLVTFEGFACPGLLLEIELS